MNNKGFTLVELLITITILGIVLAFSIAIVNNITVKNKSQTYQIYSDSLLQSSKVYNDSYAEDTFGNREYGCTKVPYSTLKQKDLISNMTVKGAQCGYMVDTNKDSSGVIIRKVKDKYYYETFLYCKDEGADPNPGNDYVKGGVKQYFSDLGEDYCNTTATKDSSAPTVSYRNNNSRPGRFYNSSNLPKPQVKISDAGVGLNNILDINYAWTSKNPTVELLRFTTRKGAGTTRWKDIPLSPRLTDPNTNDVEHLKVTIKNVEDLAKNVNTNDLTCSPAKDCNRTGITGTFYIDNTAPTITVTPQVTWTNREFYITMTVADPIDSHSHIRSGIKYVIYELTNNYTPSANKTITISTDNDDERPGYTSSGNNDYARGGETASGHKDFKRKIHIKDPGNYTLKVTVEDWAGNKKTNVYRNYYQYDDIDPTCGTQSPRDPAWINRDRIVSIGCSDQNSLSKCKQGRFSDTFGESEYGKITIEDNAGNKVNCTVVTRVDKTPPKCTSRGGSTTWTKSDVTIYGDCKDRGSVQSKCKQETYTRVYSGNVNTQKARVRRVYDKAGNSADCPDNQHVHIDNKPPSCKVEIYNRYVRKPNTPLAGAVHCYDNYSVAKCHEWKRSECINTFCENRTTYEKTELHVNNMRGPGSFDYKVTDSAGNQATCNVYVLPASCQILESTGIKYGSCSNDGTQYNGCVCQPYYACPSGWWSAHETTYCTLQNFSGTNRYTLSYSWYCTGYKQYNDDGNKCGYYVASH